MEVVSLLSAVAALVLAAAGVTKFIQPEATSDMLSAIGAPTGSAVVRAIGISELAIGIAVLSTTANLAPMVMALAYGTFTTAIAVLRHRSPSTPCGCFGSWSSPPGVRHLIVNGAAAAVALLAAATSSPAWPLSLSGWALGVYAALVAAGSIGVIALLGGSKRPVDPRRTRGVSR